MAGANWRCTECDTFNASTAKACTVCDTARSVPAARAPEPKPGAPRATPAKSGGGGKPKRPTPARPPGDWTCLKCDTNNERTDLSCIACETGWRAATKKPATKKPAPKKTAAKKTTARKAAPTPGATAAKPSGSARGGTGSSTSSRPRSGTSSPRSSTSTRAAGTGGTRRAAPGRTPTAEVFYPTAASSGYVPPTTTTPRPGPVTSPAPRPAPTPSYPRPTSPVYRPPKKSGLKGCVQGCLGVMFALFVLSLLAKGCAGAFSSGGSSPDPETSQNTSSCPERIASALPSGDGAELVEAFRTKNKQITLCRTGGGDLYYFGEFSDHREKGIAMSAEKTSEGYEAHNGPYRYRIHDGVVTIYQNARRIGQEDLTPEPSPS
ncbi:hypothetical protein GCM10011579_051320 [Streptomyces albiflavescens]|uniref:RanBP2-type domain-containing protein n=1 Tax=Streptomyces albiflavescens TaxID=1623582 RepID=A0A917Y8F0_9ACTN|nr:Ran-binding zinc finger domain-containing protein [Streptomyces albiflavescens]GGN73306.1 hypothetical protein GCM10011579_051320 [Streptomyces albiflavescens]